MLATDPPGNYPIIVIISGFKVAHYTFNMETRPGELFLYFQQSETMYRKKLTS